MLVTFEEVKDFLGFEENKISIDDSTNSFKYIYGEVPTTVTIDVGLYTYSQAAVALEEAINSPHITVSYNSTTKKFTLTSGALNVGVDPDGSTADFLYGFTIYQDDVAKTVTSDTEMPTYEPVLEDIHTYIEDFIKKHIHNPIESASYDEKYSGDNGLILYLDHYPITTIASLVVDDASISSSDYEIDYDTGCLYYGGGFSNGFNNIEINYVAGHDTIPETLKFAVLNMIKFYYEKYKSNLIGITEYSISSLKQKYESYLLWEVQKTSEFYTKVRVG